MTTCISPQIFGACSMYMTLPVIFLSIACSDCLGNAIDHLATVKECSDCPQFFVDFLFGLGKTAVMAHVQKDIYNIGFVTPYTSSITRLCATYGPVSGLELLSPNLTGNICPQNNVQAHGEQGPNLKISKGLLVKWFLVFCIQITISGP